MPSAEPNPRLNTIRVTDADNPVLRTLLQPYRNQKDAWLRAQRSGGTGLPGEGLFIAEGELVVRTLLGSPHEVVSLLCTPARLLSLADAFGSLPRDTPVLLADRPVLADVVGFDLHRGVLALGRRSAAPDAADLTARARLLVICESLANHDNLGAVFRNTACLAGAGWSPDGDLPAAVLLSPGCCDPLYRKSLRVSMGHALRVPYATLDPWPDRLADLVAAGFETLALTPGEAAEDIQAVQPASPERRLAVLLGAEGPGLSPGAMAAAARRIRIPMAPGADSLNVATSLAVALSHLLPGGLPGR